MINKILVVDDEKSIADAISYALKREGYEVRASYDGEEAIKQVKAFSPLIIILDIMMPKLNGFDVCRKLQNSGIGVIMLTAKNDVVDRILGLELGADDYINKPFDIRELIARVNALVRRLEKSNRIEDVIEINNLKIIESQRKVLVEGNNIELTPKEFDLLYILITHIERVYSRDELLDIVWGMEYIGGTRTVDIHIQRLRKKLGQKYENIINTVHGIGYRAARDIYED